MKKSVLPCLLLILFLFHADYVTEGARYGLLLWYNSVVPALFPFMVLSGILVAGGGISVLMAPLYRLLHPFLPITPEGCYVLASGLLCGYPMGAKTCGDFLREGRISTEEGRFLMAVSNHPSPMFLLGYVFPFFENKMTVWRLLLSVYAPVLLLAFWAQRIYFPKGQRRSRLKPQKKEKKRTAPEGKLSSDQAILSAVEILCKIGGYLMFFSILIVFLRHMDWIPASLRLVLMGAMEMTTGVRETALSLPFPISGAAAAAALTFGGFSGIFQTKAVLPGAILPASQKEPAKADSFSGVSIRSYVCWKLLHAALAAVFFMILGFL